MTLLDIVWASLAVVSGVTFACLARAQWLKLQARRRERQARENAALMISYLTSKPDTD